MPDRAGNDAATTSLMHFHFLDSVNKFCDETNHVKDVKNKQNILCGGKSVMETIRSSPDYKMVTDKQSFVKTPTFSVTKPFNHPALYLLFDRAMHTDEVSYVHEVNGLLMSTGCFLIQICFVHFRLPAL